MNNHSLFHLNLSSYLLDTTLVKLASNEEIVHPRIRPLPKLSGETMSDCRRWTTPKLVSSLQRNPLMAERIQRLRTVFGVDPSPAHLGVGDGGEVSRFRLLKQAISYRGPM